MKVELQKPDQEIDESKLGRVVKKSEAATATEEVSAHGAQVDFSCPNCGDHLTAWMDYNPQWFRCPNCYHMILVHV